MGYDFDQPKFSLIQPYSVAEYQPANNEAGCVVRYKFAFRWCDDQVELLVFRFLEYAHISFRVRPGG